VTDAGFSLKIANDQRKPGPGKTALVVDDNPRMRDIFAAAFLSDGFEICAEAENGKEGIEAAEPIKPVVQQWPQLQRQALCFLFARDSDHCSSEPASRVDTSHQQSDIWNRRHSVIFCDYFGSVMVRV
jgi:CheY-like chemotaxis protein